ncbi:hypothetical protein Fmac_028605 [Flemingia macrophylla]|uniref:Uncharacterized protein n=1 Tax=Flemingia macrophylla TaxID=520843 RepID=A0ABD1L822_9FABA
MSIPRLSLETPIADQLTSRDKALDREDGSQLLALRIRSLPLLQESAASVLPMTSLQQSRVDEHPEAYAANTYSKPPQQQRQGVQDVAIDTSAKTRKLEGKLDALVKLVAQLAANQKPASAARAYGIRSSNDHHTSVCPSLQQSGFRARNDAIVIRGVHEMAIDTSAETRKLERKLEALMNLVTQLAANQKSASIARVCGIRSSNDHHTSVYPSSQQSRVDEHPEGYAETPMADHHTNTPVETIKLEGKLDAFVNLVTQLAVNQKLVSVARVCEIRSSNDHHTSVCLSSARNHAILIRGVHDVATDTSAETRNLEGKLDALVNLVSHLAANQKPASVARVCDICSSNDHHTSVCPSSQQSGFIARNDAIIIRGVHDVATDTSAETRKLEGKLDALLNLGTHLAVNQKPASVTRVCGIRSSNDHHTSVCSSSQQSGVDEHPEAYAGNTYSRPPQEERQGTS